MTTIASQITSLTVVYSTVFSDADQRQHQSSASLAFVWGIHRDRWIPRTKGQLRGKCFHLMTSSWKMSCYNYTIVASLANHITKWTHTRVKIDLLWCHDMASENFYILWFINGLLLCGTKTESVLTSLNDILKTNNSAYSREMPYMCFKLYLGRQNFLQIHSAIQLLT